MRVHLTDLQPGDRLAEDIFTEQGLHVLSSGTVLQERDLSRLELLHIGYVEIERRSPVYRTEFATGEPEPEAARQLRQRLLPYYEDAVAGCELLFKRAVEEGRILESEAEESFRPLVDNFKAERDVISLLLMLNSQDDYTYQHSVQVGMLSFYLAKWLGWSEEETLLAGKAGFLHDIGKCRIPDTILGKPGKLTDEEFAEVRRHTVYGHEIITASGGDPAVAVAALQHHERSNGSGYPSGLAGDSIHPMARVVAVADVYSAMISSRAYQEKQDLLAVLKELHRLSFKELDPRMTQTFIRHMLPNFIGKKAELASGEVGIVVMNHPTDLFRPLIRIGERYVDTSSDSSCEIKQIIL